MRNLKFLSLFLFVFSIFSCSPFTASISDYYNKYTESAGLLDVEYPENSIFSNKIQLNCVGSDADSIINLNLFNPKKLNMQIVFEIDIESEIGDALKDGNHYFGEDTFTIVNLNENSSCAQLVFNKGFINYIDSGNIIDSNGKPVKTIIGTITTGIPILQDSEGDGTSNPEKYRDIREYPFTICFNSAPPDIKNAMFQLTQNGSGQYILCFYLPKVKGTVHECDTKKIKIGSDTFYFKDTGSGVDFYTDEGCTTAADSTKIAASYSGSLYPAVPGISFSTPTSGYYPVYYITGAAFSRNEIKYDIVLEDDFGLYKSVGVSSKGEKLTAVIIPNETDYIGTEDGYCEIQLTHDGKTITGDTVSGVTIYYTVEQGGNVVASGSGASGVKVKIPSGKGYTIKAVARKPYYVESDEESKSGINVQRSIIYYVSQNGKSPENGALGTKASPFRTIQQAVDDITNQVDEGFAVVTDGYTINLLSNITPDESDTFDNNHNQSMICITKSYNYTINGNGHTIDAQRDSSNKGRVIYVGDSTNNCNLTIENAILTGAYFPGGHGGAICFQKGKKLILKNVEIKNNKANYGAGIGLYADCDFISGSIHDNEAKAGGAVNIISGATLSLGDNSNISSIVNIYNNKVTESAGGMNVYGALTINQAKIFDNFIKATADIPSNVYLKKIDETNNQIITVGGNLSGCTIGVATEKTPSSGSTIPITTGYLTHNNGVPPSKIFKSDAGYGVIMDEINNAEAVLAVGGGSIDVPSESYDNVKISVDKTIFLTKNTGNSLTVTSNVKSGTSYVNIPLNECTYSYELYNHGEKVNGIISTGSAKNIVNFNCASLPNESFELYVYLEYKGKKYQGVFPIEIRGPIGTKSSGETLAVGDIVFNDGTATPYSVIKARPDGKCTDAEKNAAIAVIFRVGDGTEENKTLGVGINQSSGICWCKNCKGVDINFTDTICVPDSGTNKPNWQFNNSSNKDGSKNLEKMINDGADDTGITFNADGTVNFTTSTKSTLTTNYPSFEFAYYYGKNGHNIISGSEYETGWYLPSLSELNDIYKNRTVVDNVLGITGGDKLGTNRYWSSSQYNSNVISACYFNFEDGGWYSIGKAYIGLNNVRAVRVFN